MKNSLETRLGIFVVFVAIAAVVIVETLNNWQFYQGGYRISAMFNTVHELKVGDPVKMAGVEVGRVEKVALENEKVRVTMRINSSAAVKTDSRASIKFAGLMGQNFVSLSFGTPGAPRAMGGAVLATVEQPDLNAIMAKLNNAATGIQNLTKSFTGDTLNNLLGPLTDLVRENHAKLTASVSNLESISAQIASGQGTVGKLIYSQKLYDSAMSTVSNLQTTVTNLQNTFAVARGVLNGIKEGRGTLGKLATDPSLYNETASSMTNLNQILQKINQGHGTVGKLVNNQEFYKNAKLTLQKVDKAADSLEDQGPLSVLGIVANNLGL